MRARHRQPPSTRAAELLRFATAGSVDDGKSTLIGRLLYDTKAIFEDQLEQVAARLRAPARRQRQRQRRPRAAHRRPARRARAGHHDRRRLPLLHDAAAQLHHRRHPRPRPLHAQHGHRRVDGRPRAHPRRRAQRRRPAVAPPRVHRVAAAHPPPRRVREQDGPRRLGRGRLRVRSSTTSRTSRRSSRSPTRRSSRSARSTATTSSSAPSGCPGTTARRCSTTSSTSTSRRTAT